MNLRLRILSLSVVVAATHLAMAECGNINCSFLYLGYDALNAMHGKEYREADFMEMTAATSVLDACYPAAFGEMRRLNFMLYSLERACSAGDGNDFSNRIDALSAFVKDKRDTACSDSSSRDLEIIHNGELSFMAEKIEFSFARMILLKHGRRNLLGTEEIVRVIPDNFFMEQFGHKSESAEKICAFRNMLLCAVKVVDFVGTYGLLPSALSTLSISPNFTACSGERRIIYETDGAHWSLRCDGPGSCPIIPCKERVPTILAGGWNNLCLDDTFNLRRRELYEGRAMRSFGGRGEWYVDHVRVSCTNAVHNILFRKAENIYHSNASSR